MYLTLVIGSTGQGKTTFVKKTIGDKPCYIFDVNNEYEFSEDIEDEQARDTELDMKKFIQTCSNDIYNRVVVVEDATGYMKGNLGADIIKMVQRKRHTNNNYIFLFHSVAAVPRQIYDFANYIVLLRTADLEAEVKKKCPKVLPSFISLKRSSVKYDKRIIKLI
jgi:hypothetical protein